MKHSLRTYSIINHWKYDVRWVFWWNINSSELFGFETTDSKYSLQNIKTFMMQNKILVIGFSTTIFLDFNFSGNGKISWKSWQLYLLQDCFLLVVAENESNSFCSTETQFESLLPCAFICYSIVLGFRFYFCISRFGVFNIYRLSEFRRKLSCHLCDDNHETAKRIFCFVRT